MNNYPPNVDLEEIGVIKQDKQCPNCSLIVEGYETNDGLFCEECDNELE